MSNLKDVIAGVIADNIEVSADDIFPEGGGPITVREVSNRVQRICAEAYLETAAEFGLVLSENDEPDESEEEKPKPARKRKSPAVISKVIELGLESEVPPRDIPAEIERIFHGNETISYSQVCKILAEERKRRQEAAKEFKGEAALDEGHQQQAVIESRINEKGDLVGTVVPPLTPEITEEINEEDQGADIESDSALKRAFDEARNEQETEEEQETPPLQKVIDEMKGVSEMESENTDDTPF